VAQAFFPIDPVEVTPGSTGWQDVNGADFGVPEGATGVLTHIVNTHASNTYACGLRKNGSTDTRTPNRRPATHCWSAIGVDDNRIFEANVGDTTSIDIYLIGYTKSGVTFFTNSYTKAPDAGDWEDVDCSECPNAIGLIWEIIGHPWLVQDFGIRKNGSTDNRLGEVVSRHGFGAIIGCDSSQICEIYRENALQNCYLVGYITDGATFNTNGTDVSLSTIQTWLDLTALPATSVMGFIEVNCVTTGPNYYYGLRKNGSAENIDQTSANHNWAFVECDASQIIEGKTITTDLDFFFIGYATAPAGEVTVGRLVYGGLVNSGLVGGKLIG